ncbi:MAG: hypothetical protein Q4F84_05910 [Fibrobacter sp.]|nr:hypothetical protein [Fibrobacter sp.]
MREKYHNIYRIPSARAVWHKYDDGIYFITICTSGRYHYLGEITNKPREIQLTQIGKYSTEIFTNITSYYSYAKISSFVIMPNHIHAIITIDLSCRRNTIHHDSFTNRNSVKSHGNPMLSVCLGTVVRGIKARITHYAHVNKFIFGWQSRFHDHIIRDQKEFNDITLYIENNVVNWEIDCFNEINKKSSLNNIRK